MVFVPVIKDGLPLVKDDGFGNLVPAVAEDPCDCCEPGYPCGGCTDDLPLFITLNVAGMLPGDDIFTSCPGCPNLNGSWVLQNQGPFSCSYRGVYTINFGACDYSGRFSVTFGVDVSFTYISMFAVPQGGTDSYNASFTRPGGNSCTTDLANATSLASVFGFPQHCKYDGVSPWSISL